MKFLSYVVVFLMLVSCDKKNIETWEGGNFVYFTEEELLYGNESTVADSIDVSFFFYLDDVIDFPLEVALTGELLSEDTPFKVVVNKEKSNLPENLYEIPDHFIFNKDQLKDTIYVTLKKDPILKEKKYDLQLEIVKYGNISSHKGKNATRLLKVSDIAVRPTWWVENPIEWYYLGTYSAKKYKLFKEITKAESLDLNDLGKARLLCLEFQQWLDNQDPKIIDEDGNPMKTEVIG